MKNLFLSLALTMAAQSALAASQVVCKTTLSNETGACTLQISVAFPNAADPTQVSLNRQVVCSNSPAENLTGTLTLNPQVSASLETIYPGNSVNAYIGTIQNAPQYMFIMDTKITPSAISSSAVGVELGRGIEMGAEHGGSGGDMPCVAQ